MCGFHIPRPFPFGDLPALTAALAGKAEETIGMVLKEIGTIMDK